MSEIYIPRYPHDSFVFIEQAAAEVVDETLVKMLRLSAMVDIQGQQLITEDPLTINATTGRHEAKPTPLACSLAPLGLSMVRMATSLRMRRLGDHRPHELPAQLPVLCLYEQLFDRYIDVPVLPELGFELRNA